MANLTRTSGARSYSRTPSRSIRWRSSAGASLRMTMSSSVLETSRPRRAARRRIVAPRSARAEDSSRSKPMSKSLSARACADARLPNRYASCTSGRSFMAVRSRAAADWSSGFTRARYSTSATHATSQPRTQARPVFPQLNRPTRFAAPFRAVQGRSAPPPGRHRRRGSGRKSLRSWFLGCTRVPAGGATAAEQCRGDVQFEVDP